MSYYIGAFIAFSLPFSVLYFEMQGERNSQLISIVQFLGGISLMGFPIFFLNSGLHLFDVYWRHVIQDHYLWIIAGLVMAILLHTVPKLFSK